MNNSTSALIAFAIVNVVFASRKGYNPFIWLFSAGFIGTMILSSLPSVKEEKDTEIRQKLKRRGDKIGLITAGITIVFGIVLSIALQGYQN